MITVFKIDFAANSWYAKTIAVMTNTVHYSTQ